MAHDVFISYSSKDKSVADAACAVLEGRRARCWVAPRDIAAGSDWGESIIDAIAGSRVMVLVFSANANASPQVKREVERAVNKGVTVVPFRIENVPLCKTLEYFVSTPHWMDAYTEPLEKHLGKLAETVLAILQTPAVEETAPVSGGPAVAKRQDDDSSVPPTRHRVVPRAGVFAALAVGVTGALLARAMLSSTPPAAEADQTIKTRVDAPAAKHVPEIAKTQAATAPSANLTASAVPQAPLSKPEIPTTAPLETTDPKSVVETTDMRERAVATAQARRLRVRAVALIGGERYCVINGRRFEEGESVDGFRVEQILANRVIVSRGKFRFELRPQADVDSHVVGRANIDSGTQEERPEPSGPPRGNNGGPIVFMPGPGSGPGGGPPGSPPPPPPPGGPRPPRR